MRALYFQQTGSLDALRVADLATPTPGPGEVLMQVKAAAINPSDVKNVQGKMHETTVPRVPGRDFAGIIAGGDRSAPCGDVSEEGPRLYRDLAEARVKTKAILVP